MTTFLKITLLWQPINKTNGWYGNFLPQQLTLVIEWKVLACTGSSNETVFASGVFNGGAEPGVNDNGLILRVA